MTLRIVLSLLLLAPTLPAARLKDLASIEGVRENQLIGYGLVVGLAQAVALFEMISTADLGHARLAVFGPRAYAESTGGTSFRLKIGVARAWIAANFPRIRPGATWPPRPSSPPASGVAGSPGPSPSSP